MGSLTDYVPAPTLEWLLVAEPARIASEPGVLAALAPLVDDADFRRFAERSGFDPRHTPQLVVAGFEVGTLYLLSEGKRGPRIERAFQDRLLRGEVIEQVHPAITRIRGVAGTRPQALLHARDQLVAVAVDDTRLVRLVEGYLLGRFRKTPTALSGAALRHHADFAASAPLRLWIPGAPGEGPLGPLSGRSGEDPSDAGAIETPGPPDSVLAGVTATMAAAEFLGSKACPCEGDAAGPVLRLHLALAGPWEPTEANPAVLESLWLNVARSPTGHLLGLDEPLALPAVEVVGAGQGARVELQVDYALRPLLRRLRGVVAGTLEELFSGPDGPAAGFNGASSG